MFLSVICPVLNGEKYIKNNILKFFVNSKPLDKELFIIDGGSTDSTINIVKNWIKKYPNIILINNPHKYVPHALNLGIKRSSGQFIARLDVHTEYPIDYFEQCIEISTSIGADNIGGTIISCGISITGKANAYCMSSIFGVGNSIPRIRMFDGFVDSIAFGFWKKEVFEKFGDFDESLIKNQDEDHNFRIKENGGKIYQSSLIETKYYVRENIIGLIKQMFNYGLFKPQVLIKNISRFRIRYIIPTLFTIYLIICLFVSNYFLFFPLLIYLFVSFIFSFNNHKNIIIKILSMIVYPCMHISYGLGFFIGLFNVRKS